MKLLNWAKKHIYLAVAIVVFTTTAIAGGATMLSSYIDYSNYEKDYYIQQLNTKAESPTAPTGVYIDDDFSVLKNDNSCTVEFSKSNYPKKLAILAKDFKCEPADNSEDSFVVNADEENLSKQYIGGMENVGGKISVTLNAAANTYCDLEFVLASSIAGQDGFYKETKDLLENVSFKINGTEVLGEIYLSSTKVGINWHHLVLESLALKSGENTIEISGTKTDSSNKSHKIFPFVRNVNAYSNATITIGE